MHARTQFSMTDRIQIGTKAYARAHSDTQCVPTIFCRSQAQCTIFWPEEVETCCSVCVWNITNYAWTTIDASQFHQTQFPCKINIPYTHAQPYKIRYINKSDKCNLFYTFDYSICCCAFCLSHIWFQHIQAAFVFLLSAMSIDSKLSLGGLSASRKNRTYGRMCSCVSRAHHILLG